MNDLGLSGGRGGRTDQGAVLDLGLLAHAKEKKVSGQQAG
jgi:hypothetical protein